MDELVALITVSELANYLNVKPESVRRLARKGEIPSIRVGRHLIRFRKSEIDAWLEIRNNQRIEMHP